MQTPQAIRQKMNGADWGILLTLSVTWGLSFIFTEVAVSNGLPVLTVVALRVGFAAVALNIFIIVKKQSLRAVRPIWRGLFLMALFGHVVPFSLLAWAHLYITASLASIFNACVPFCTVLIAHVMTGDERFKASKIIGVFLGLIGVAIIIGPQSVLSMSDEFFAEMLMLVVVCLYAWVTVYARRFTGRADISPTAIATGQLTFSALIILPFALIFEAPWMLPMPSIATISAVVALGVVSTAFAFVLYYHLIGRVGATNTSLVTFLIPVNTIWIGTLFLNESLKHSDIVGVAFIALGLVVIDSRLCSRVFKR